MPVTINGTTGVVTPGATIGSINGILKSSSGVVSQASVGTDYSQLILATAQTASGTAVDFTSIPSWAKRITVIFNGVSTSGNSNILIQIGSGSITNTGYNSGSTANNSNTTSTTGFIISNTISSGVLLSGGICISNISGNAWISFGVVFQYALFATQSAGNITLSNALDRLRLTTVNGTDTFDAGTINISYE